MQPTETIDLSSVITSILQMLLTFFFDFFRQGLAALLF